MTSARGSQSDRPAGRTKRTTPIGAGGEPSVWLMGASLIVCVGLIVAVSVLIVRRGAATFWPRPIERITLESGEAFFGQSVERRENTKTGASEERFRVGNRDLGQDSARWVDTETITERSAPEGARLVERDTWGLFFGTVERVERLAPPAGGGAGERSVTVLAEGAEAGAVLDELLPRAAERRREIRAIAASRIPAVESRIESARLDRRALLRADGDDARGLGWGAFAGLVVVGGLAGAVLGAARLRRVLPSAARPLVWSVLLAILLAGWLERPWQSGPPTGPALERRLVEIDERVTRLEARRTELTDRLGALREEDARERVVIVDPRTGRFAPASQSSPEDPMLISQVIRAAEINAMGFGDRLGLYGARWGDFLSRAPGEAPGTGGVFPVILGTVVLTLLLTVSVVPLGVVAALYMREYAKQGLLTSIVRIAINNLAGVPSIVYGMFGLGFFCYFLGGWIDGGPGTAAVSRASWWWIVAGVALCVGVAGAIAALGGKKRATVVGLLWAGAAGLAAWAVFATPYFGGFFPEKLPEQPTFGGRGILWAALTLALLTLPVVIVATEEAVAAVPGSMREGSLGCGATKWQTIRRVVLPSALPGVMTGAILAMARGAGEVAPLMLVGAVNLAPAPPISFEPPFLHGDRTFMHLGFHIYSVGFQSPDVEATEPLVWTITLLLVLVVVLLNIGAVYIRARLRSKFGGSAV